MPAPVIIPKVPPNIPPAPKTPPIRNPRRNPFPDGVPPGNKRPPDQDDCKEICVWAIVPVKTPKRIRYQYPGEPAIEVEGESFSIENIPGRVIATYTPNATVRISGNHAPWITWATNPFVAWLNLILNPSYVSFSPSPSFRGEFLRWEWANPLGDNGNATYNYAMIDIFYRDTSGIEQIGRLLPNQSSNNYSFWFYTPDSRSLVSLNLNPSNPQQIDQCRFRIFNAAGQTILDITRNVCPTVTEIPENCTFNETDRRLIYRYIQPKFSNNRIVVETRANCIDVYLNLLLGQGALAMKMATECSPVGCPPPKYEIDCCENDKCKDRKCPKGTAKRILIGGSRLQCVDAKGCVLQEIEYDPKCERVDCRC